MQVNEYDFKRINSHFNEIDARLNKLEQEIVEFKSWYSSRFPKEDPVDFHEPLTDNDPEE